jgi:hypothetical protein
MLPLFCLVAFISVAAYVLVCLHILLLSASMQELIDEVATKQPPVCELEIN